MRKIIDKLAYDTEKATRIYRWENEYPSTDLHFCSETLYQTKSGRWFLEYEGGALSQYVVSAGSNSYTGSSGITPLTKEEARDWLESCAPADVYEQYFTPQEA